MITQISKINKESIEQAKEILLSGGVIGMPTETVYGLAAVGTNSEAVKKIYKIKGRPSDNPLICHVHKDYDISKLVLVKNDYVYKLMKKFMPGPLTIVCDSLGVICKEAVCGGDTLAIRMPSHKGCQELLRAVDMPIVAPSANLSKHTSPVTAKHVYDDLNGKIPLILDGGKCQGGIESTVLDCTTKVPRILRAGLITKEMIESVCGGCEIAEHKEGDKVKSPGVKYTHYKPKCDTILFSINEVDKAIKLYDEELKKGRKPYIMCENSLSDKLKGKNLLLLGNTGEEIASNLYDKLLEGEKKADIIIAISFGREDGVYMGIMNRLTRSCN
ncbi:MAG: threonylcarbamoyl-AMP synthase [Clostridia bacterium]|nr:threonylcarbamoyl-AMP synthase [Clostridia bacterium]